MKNLGRLSFFLDIGFEKGDDFVKKNQRRHFSKVLERFEMSNCKSRTTPSEQKLEFGSETPRDPQRSLKKIVTKALGCIICPIVRD